METLPCRRPSPQSPPIEIEEGKKGRAVLLINNLSTEIDHRSAGKEGREAVQVEGGQIVIFCVARCAVADIYSHPRADSSVFLRKAREKVDFFPRQFEPNLPNLPGIAHSE